MRNWFSSRSRGTAIVSRFVPTPTWGRVACWCPRGSSGQIRGGDAEVRARPAGVHPTVTLGKCTKWKKPAARPRCPGPAHPVSPGAGAHTRDRGIIVWFEVSDKGVLPPYLAPTSLSLAKVPSFSFLHMLKSAHTTPRISLQRWR